MKADICTYERPLSIILQQLRCKTKCSTKYYTLGTHKRAQNNIQYLCIANLPQVQLSRPIIIIMRMIIQKINSIRSWMSLTFSRRKNNKHHTHTLSGQINFHCLLIIAIVIIFHLCCEHKQKPRRVHIYLCN